MRKSSVTGDRPPLSLLSILRLSSPALPIGSFAYSQGLEYALDSGWCRDPIEVEQWIGDNLMYGLGLLDLPIYQRLYLAWEQADNEKIKYWNTTILAFRETRELYEEDVTVGRAFARWLTGLNTQCCSTLDLCPKPSVVCVHALSAILHNISCEDAMLAYAWSWVENQVTCAMKALPLGQTDGQKILNTMMPIIVEACDSATRFADNDIGSGLMGLSIASSHHEQQYCRLFRS